MIMFWKHEISRIIWRIKQTFFAITGYLNWWSSSGSGCKLCQVCSIFVFVGCPRPSWSISVSSASLNVSIHHFGELMCCSLLISTVFIFIYNPKHNFIQMVYFEFLCYKVLVLPYNASCVWHKNFEVISITQSECVSYFGYLHATHMRHICHRWPCLLYNVSPYFLIKRHDFREKRSWTKNLNFYFCTMFVWNISNSDKNWVRYYHKCTQVCM